MKKLTAFLLAVLMILGTVSALADSGTNIRIGDYVYLGHWEQNDNKGDGAESIRWLVIDTDGSNLLLLSDKALENLPFNKKSDGTAWAGSYLRQWLNSDFLNRAFSETERQAIEATNVENSPNAQYGTYCGPDTHDYVFILSNKEVFGMMQKEFGL